MSRDTVAGLPRRELSVPMNEVTFNYTAAEIALRQELAEIGERDQLTSAEKDRIIQRIRELRRTWDEAVADMTGERP